jgi:hypothetical protein
LSAPTACRKTFAVKLSSHLQMIISDFLTILSLE